MQVEFVRFAASDGVILQGWLNNEDSEMAVLHLHGKSGNGYENYFLDDLREMYKKHSISFFTIDTRGKGVISDFKQGKNTKHAGSCFEIFEESIHDVRGAIEYLKSIGKRRFILQGHSLGCTKVVNFMLNEEATAVERVILLAPTDMSGWAGSHPEHAVYLARAKKLLSEGTGTKLVDSQCWLDKEPLSAQTYVSICEAGSPADVYGDQEGGALLGRLKMPVLILYGDEDIGIIQIDGNIDKWLTRVNKIKNQNTEISIIQGASHSFSGYEDKLSEAVEKFLAK